jgi:sugar lactone lactonase YvrE
MARFPARQAPRATLRRLTAADASYTLMHIVSTPGPAPLPPALEPIGTGLHRPECVLATAAGDVFVSDWRGGVTVIRHDGRQRSWLAAADLRLRPNGIAIAPDGAFLLAHLGDTAGGVWRLDAAGTARPWLTEVDSVPIPPTNFVTTDRAGRTWISVSTRCEPRQLAWRRHVADGFVVLVDERGARIVADGLHYTNEVRPCPSGRWLYVVETFGRRLVRCPIRADGEVGAPQTVVTFGGGCFPDGFAFDEAGGIWITSLVSNRLLWMPDADRLEIVLEDVNQAFVDAAEEAFAAGRLDREHLGPIPGTTLQQLTSIGFGGQDRRTAYLGSLHASCVYRFRAPVAGLAPEHWTFPAP